MPNLHVIFLPFETLGLEDINVVIVGQNPYDYEKGMASGMALSHSTKMPMSGTLQAINEEVVRCYGKGLRDSTLDGWIRQGVFLINTILTTVQRPHKSKVDHVLQWHFFMEYLFYKMSTERSGIVYILLGHKAQQYSKSIKRTSNLVLSCPFPSKRKGQSETFLGCNVFVEANKFIAKSNKVAIDWTM